MGNQFRVLVTSRSFSSTAPEPYQLLEDAGCWIMGNPYGRTLQEDELCRLIPGFDGLIVGVESVSERVLMAADELRVISVHGVGTDNIDLPAATRRGIVVTNVPGLNTAAVAEYTWGLIFALLRQIPKAVESTKNGSWQRLLGVGLTGKTLGIVGLGSIGKSVARMGQGFGMQIIGYTPHPNQQALEELNICYAQLDEVIEQADILTLHVPLTKETVGLINQERIGRMKSGAYLINTSRGEVIDEAALAKALLARQLSGAALDVMQVEPPRSDNPLLGLDNCLITPHMASFTGNSIAQMSRVAAENLLQVLIGLRPASCANPAVYSPTNRQE